MNQISTLRILVSTRTAARIGSAIGKIMDGRPYELVEASSVPGDVPGDIDIAFISRDVTNTSTKYVVTESTQSYYDSLHASPRLQWVQIHSAGIDRPVYGILQDRGVEVKAASGVTAENVAQTALAGFLSLAREFPKLAVAQREHQWLLVQTQPRDLAGQSAVIVGWGPIARRIGEFLQMLGLSISVVRSSAEPAGEGIETVAFEALDSTLAQTDWLILACPLTERTRGLVGAASFAAIKRGARLINMARGEVVDESELIAALQSGALSGAYLDVVRHEPLEAASPLWDIPNVIITPHFAGHSDGNEARIDALFLDNLQRYLAAR